MKSKTLSYTALAVALGITGTILASKIIGNGYKADPACNDQRTAATDCDKAAIANLEQPTPMKVLPMQPTPMRPASAEDTASKPD